MAVRIVGRVVAALLVVGSVLVAAAGPASAAITGRITLYPQAPGTYPVGISGSPGDLWVRASVYGGSRYGAVVERITTGGAPDGSVGVGSLDVPVYRPIVAGPGGSAYTIGGFQLANRVTSTLTVSNGGWTSGLHALALAGSTPYWGGACGSTVCTDVLLQGFPFMTPVVDVPGHITALAGGSSGEADMIFGPRTYAFYSGGTLTACNGGAAAFPSDSTLVDLTSGPEGVWLADAGRNSIWRYDGSCAATEFPVPGGATPRHLTEGPDGAIWFTTSGGIWQLRPTSGVFTEYTDPGLNDPEEITSGSDGNIWFTDTDGHQIGKVEPLSGVALAPYLVNFHVVPLGGSSTGTVPVHAPGGLTGIYVLGADFSGGTPANPLAPPALNADCPPTCSVGVTFAPPVGSRPGFQVGLLVVTSAQGSPQFRWLVGWAAPAGARP